MMRYCGNILQNGVKNAMIRSANGSKSSIRTSSMTLSSFGKRSVTTYTQYINGEWTPESSHEYLTVENPSSQEILSQVPVGNASDANAALQAASDAQPAWETVPANQRAGVLTKLAALMEERRVELAKTLASEQAKTMALAQVEIDASVEYLRYYAGLARTIEGEIVPSDRPGEQIYLHRVPLGVVVGICPWNFPIYVYVRKIAPALVTGNTVVVKSSEFTPNTSFEVTKLLEEAGCPPGVVNVVTGTGPNIGKPLCESPIPGIISMTGSVATGQAIMAMASPYMTKLSLELGGKCPVIVMDDADLQQAIDCTWASRVIYSGQVCNCAERVYVHESIADAFTEGLVRKMESTKIGASPDDADIDMCGLINPAQLDKVKGMVDRAVTEGAEVLTGGDINSNVSSSGYHYQPTVLTNVSQSSEIIRKEIFGPVLPVMKFTDLDEALLLANDCEYGLTSSIFTKSANNVHKAMTGFKFGETYVNREHFEAIQGFHAGWRKSGVGGADGKHGMYEFLGTRCVYWCKSD